MSQATQTEEIAVRVRPGRYYNDESQVPRLNYAPGTVLNVTPGVLHQSRSILVECGTEEEAALAPLYRERGELAPGLPTVAPKTQKRGPGRPRKDAAE